MLFWSLPPIKGPQKPAFIAVWPLVRKPPSHYCVSVLPSMYLLDMVKDYITRTRASIKGAVLKARDTAGRALVV